VGLGPRRWLVAAAITASVLALGTASAASGASGDKTPPPPTRDGDSLAPLLGTDAAGVVPGQYIVVYRKDVAAKTLAAASKGRRHRYSSALKGFAGALSAADLKRLRRDPNVAYIQADRVITISTTQTGATWGLDRVDQRNLPLNGTYTYTPTGAGVTAYIIDTGIRFDHAEFGGRAVTGYDAVDGGSADDCNGHGTHVSGTVGGTTYGVAKAVKLVGVRVLNCSGSGTTSQVVAGIDWVTANHQAGQPAVANMSLGGGADTVLDDAVRRSIADGITYAIAAGNSNANACSSSPARVTEAITVGATTNTDARSSFSNYGTCLDLFAPGSSITSAWYTSTTATNTISGTSMATPHVTGVAALYLQGAPTAAPATVRDAIVNTATTNVVTNPGTGSPNRLLYSPLTGGGSPPPPPPANCAVETYTGTLTYAGDADIQPNGTYFYTPTAGTHYGCLTGPSGADFDLALYRWSGSAWTRVAVSQGFTSTENITYNGTAGYYYWRVYSYSGTGSYTLKIKRP
jgi:subtilisin family serine protease